MTISSTHNNDKELLSPFLFSLTYFNIFLNLMKKIKKIHCKIKRYVNIPEEYLLVKAKNQLLNDRKYHRR